MVKLVHDHHLDAECIRAVNQLNTHNPDGSYQFF
jgi:single-stranded DNA-specific DHH superfamily exonuclease